MQNVLESIGDRRILVLLDEFEKIQERIESGITSPMVPENLRYLLHTYRRFSTILAGAKRLRRLRQNHWSALFGLGHRIEVGALSPEEAADLVTRPAEGRLLFLNESRDLIVSLCACQPYLIQCLCNHIFIACARRRERTVTTTLVRETAQAMVHDNEHFQTLWDQFIQTERQRFLLLLCQRLSRLPDPVTLRLLDAKLEEYGLHVTPGKELGEDLLSLRELELLRLAGGARGDVYQMNVPLMAEWIEQHKDLEDQRRRAIHESSEVTS